MPRYYFHEGHELLDDGAARLEAREAFGAMIAEGTVNDGDHMEVLHEQGRQVAMLSFRSKYSPC
jgi:hypothetical protein